MKLKKIIESCYLCVKYPFLYPRNRWTGKHWQSWKLIKYMYGNRGLWPKPEDTKGIWDKAFQNDYDEEGHIHTIIKSYLWAIWYYVVCFIAEYVLPVFHCIPTYTELDAMEPGWRKAFGIQMCKEIKRAILKSGGRKYLKSYRIMQIKEKFGSLRWYDNGQTPEVRQVVEKYEESSYNTCINCGKPATKMTGGWICPYCDDCFPKDHFVYMERDNESWKMTKKWEEKEKELDKMYEMERNS